jgi:hypothetical protein
MKLLIVKLTLCLIVNGHFFNAEAKEKVSDFEQILRIWDGTFFYRFLTIEENETHFRIKLEGASLEQFIETQLFYWHIEFAPKPKALIKELVFLSDKKNCISDSTYDLAESYFLDCLIKNSASEIYLRSGDLNYEDSVLSKGVIKPVWGKIDLNLSFSLQGDDLTLSLTTTHQFPINIFQAHFFNSIRR